MSIDAKDLYNAEILINKNRDGYNTKRANGEQNLNKYINTLDYSLESIKLHKVYTRVFRRNDFTFSVNKKDYSEHVINVTFKYSYKLYNKSFKNTYIKSGYSLSELDFDDNICIIDGELVGITVDTPVENNQLYVFSNKFFGYDDEKKIYKQIAQFPVILNRKKLREHLYQNGFLVNGIKYVRYKRSSGSSRVGKCLFINEALYNRIHKWELCSLKISEGDEIDLAAFESYISLTSSSIIDTIEIKSENILVIDDYESVFKDRAVSVEIDKENQKLKSSAKEVEIINNIWDGQSLLDESFFADKYCKFGMLLLRNRFFKSCAFNTNIQKYFSDNGITDISQLNGFTLANNISEVKLITTPSSIKYLKFGTLRQWLKNIETIFGIVKHEKPPFYFDGRMVQCHYQLLNTLQMSYEEMAEFLKPSLDYITEVKTDSCILKHHIRTPKNYIPSKIKNMNDIIIGLLGLNKDFTKTKYYLDFRDELVNSMIKNLKRGHVLVNGNYSTLFGNGLEMLKQSIGKFDGRSDIGIGSIISKRFKINEIILGSRSPHITMANVYLAKNTCNKDFDKYFNLSKEIVCINSIGENLLQRFNGADCDSDSILLTNNKLLISSAQKNYDKFLVPTSFVESKKTKRYYTKEQQADLDVKTSINKIGEIVNLSQELNSKLWHNINSGQNIEDNLELYCDICKLAVLSGIEIDKAKKEFLVNSGKEIEKLKQKYLWIALNGKIRKPYFFKMITKDNGYQLNPKVEYKYFYTSMDYLQKIVNRYNYKFRKKKRAKLKFISLSYVFKSIKLENISGSHYIKKNKIIDIIFEYKNKISLLYRNMRNIKSMEHVDRLSLLNRIQDLRLEYIEKILELKINKNVSYLLFKSLDNPEYSFIRNMMFECFFNICSDDFWELMKEYKNPSETLVEAEDGDIDLFGYKFKKVISENR